MKTNKNTEQNIRPVAQALVACAGYESIAAAKTHLNSYRTSLEEKRKECIQKRLERQKKKKYDQIGMLMRGAWYGAELMAGRVGEELREMPEDILQAFAQLLGSSVGNISEAPSALPLPIEEIKKSAAEKNKDYMQNLVRSISTRSRCRTATGRKRDMSAQKPITIVDTKNSDINITKLIEAINKFLTRNCGTINITSHRGDVPLFALKYFINISNVSLALSQAFLKLSMAYLQHKIDRDKYRYYLGQIPVFPPPEIRILFIDKILWIK